MEEIGSLSYSYQQAILNPEWINRSNEIKNKYNLTCQSCGKKNTILEVHHRYYVIGRLPWEYPDDALVSLCQHCHHQVDHINEVPRYSSNSMGLLAKENYQLFKIKTEEIENNKKKAIEHKKKLAIEERNRKENSWSILEIILFPISIILYLVADIFPGLIARAFIWFVGSTVSVIPLILLVDTIPWLGALIFFLGLALIVKIDNRLFGE